MPTDVLMLVIEYMVVDPHGGYDAMSLCYLDQTCHYFHDASKYNKDNLSLTERAAKKVGYKSI